MNLTSEEKGGPREVTFCRHDASNPKNELGSAEIRSYGKSKIFSTANGFRIFRKKSGNFHPFEYGNIQKPFLPDLAQNQKFVWILFSLLNMDSGFKAF